MTSKPGFFDFLKNFVISFPGNTMKWKLVLLLIFYHQSHIWQIFVSQIMGGWWSLFLACRETSKFSTSWYHHFGCAYLDMPKVPRIWRFHVYAISPEKHRVEVVILPADKYKSFLQGDSIFDM